MTETQTRLASGLALALVLGAPAWLGGWWFLVAVAALYGVSLWEWVRLCRRGAGGERVLVGGALYLAAAVGAIIAVRFADDGLVLLAWVVAAVVATDIGAYFTGRAIGGPRLAPRISPGKTISGLAGGCVAAVAVSALMTMFLPGSIGLGFACATGLAVALSGQAGDLLESWFKRRAGVKDSGRLLPGHGGLLDRLDGYLLALPVFALMTLSL